MVAYYLVWKFYIVENRWSEKKRPALFLSKVWMTTMTKKYYWPLILIVRSLRIPKHVLELSNSIGKLVKCYEMSDRLTEKEYLHELFKPFSWAWLASRMVGGGWGGGVVWRGLGDVVRVPILFPLFVPLWAPLYNLRWVLLHLSIEKIKNVLDALKCKKIIQT